MSTELKIKGRIQNKHGTEADWLKSVYIDGDVNKGFLTHPFIPLDGELIIYDPDAIYTYKRFKFGDGVSTVAQLPFSLTADPNENIIALNINGPEITYTRANGTKGTILNQDDAVRYFLASDEITGLTRLYSTIGENEDGTMTQKAIKTELDKKVGVAIDSDLHQLIFTK